MGVDVTRHYLREVFGVNGQHFARLVKKGILPRGRNGSFDLKACVQGLLRYWRNRAREAEGALERADRWIANATADMDAELETMLEEIESISGQQKGLTTIRLTRVNRRYTNNPVPREWR